MAADATISRKCQKVEDLAEAMSKTENISQKARTSRYLLALFCLFAGPLYAQLVNLEQWSIDDGMPQSQVRSMIQDYKGYLWVCTFSGVARFNGQKWQSYGIREGLPRNETASVYEDDAGRLYLGLEKGGLMMFGDDRFSKVSDHPALQNVTVLDVLRDSGDRLWVATNEGLIRINQAGTRLWTGEDGLPGSICYALIEDANGQVLVGTDHGLVRVVDDQIHRIFPEDAEVRDLAVHLGEIYAATSKGLWLVSAGEVRPVLVDGTPLNRELRCLASSSDGYLWIGSDNHGVLGIRDNETFVIDDRRGLSENKILSLVSDREGSLWIGTDGILARYKPGPFTVFTKMDGLPNNFVRCMFQDRDGGIWFGTRNGMGFLGSDGKIKSLPGYDGMRIYGVYGDENGRIFAATRDHGFVVWDGGKLRQYTVEDGLPSDNIYRSM